MGVPRQTHKKKNQKRLPVATKFDKKSTGMSKAPVEKKGSFTKHKESLEKLKQQDPEFYEFLQEEDQELLNFNPSDEGSNTSDSDVASELEEEDDAGSDKDVNISESTDNAGPEEDKSQMKDFESLVQGLSSDSDDDSHDEGGFHRFPDKLEVATDSEDEESDQEESETEVEKPISKRKRDTRVLVTMKMVNQWTQGLRQASEKSLSEVVQGFRAAVQRAGSDTVEKSRYKVESSQVFNALVRVCIKDVPNMLAQFLQYSKRKDPKDLLPSNSPQWKKIRKDMMNYLTDLIEFVSHVAEASILNVVLRHISQMVSYFACFAKLSRTLLRKMITLWSSGQETSRIMAFLSINKLTRLKQDPLLEFTIKQMYMAYVRNSKFTSPTTLPLINFMQHSMVEIFAIDQQVSYQYAFMYIRQLAIHLRNAITVKKKDTCQSVYNWQFIHSLHLWARMLSQLYPSETLEPLIYPLIQTIIGTIKLIPTARYYPLRFHCIKALNMLSSSTKTFIPILPFLVEVFDITDFTKKFKNASFKPLNFACVLKLSKAQLQEKSFKDGVIDQLYELFMENFNAHAHSIGFPELVLPAVIQMKKFVKQCKIANYTKQIKQIIDKVEETSKVIALRRKSATLNIGDNKAVDLWERKSKEDGTPLGKYYTSWRKLRDRELQHEIAGKDRISSDDLPVIERRPKISKKATDAERTEFSGLFQSESEDSDNETRFLLKEERPKKRARKEESTSYSEFTKKELDALAQSASEDEDDDDDIDEDDDEDGDDTSFDEDSDNQDDGKNFVNEDIFDDDDEDQKDIVEDFNFSSEED